MKCKECGEETLNPRLCRDCYLDELAREIGEMPLEEFEENCKKLLGKKQQSK